MNNKNHAIPQFPWHIVVASELNPGKEPLGPQSIDKNKFLEFMEKMSPSLIFSIEDKIGMGQKHINLELCFNNIKDFTPDSITKNVPALAALLNLKEALKKYHTGKILKKELLTILSKEPIPLKLSPALTKLTGKELKAAPNTQKPAPNKSEEKDKKSSLDNILNMTDLSVSEEPQGEMEKETTPIGGLFETITQDDTITITAKDMNFIEKCIDTLLSDQIDTIIHHPEFVTLEAAWRELKFLVDHTNFREGIKIDVLSCSKDQLCDTLSEKVFKLVWNGSILAPDLIVTCHPLSCAPIDYSYAENLAKLGQSTQTAIIAWAGPGFFRIKNYFDLNTHVPSISEQLRGTGYEKWRSLREKSESDWLILAANGFCLRNTYGKNGVRTKTFSYEENIKPRNLPTGSASLALASFVTETLAKLGTDTILENRGKPTIESLAIFSSKDQTNQKHSSTCTNALTNDQVWDMCDSGLTPINCQRNDASFYLESIHTYAKEDTPLPSMLLAGYISRILLYIARNDSISSDDEAESIANALVRKILIGKITGINSQECINVKITKDPGDSDKKIYELKIELPFKILGDDVTIQLSFGL